VLNQRMIDDGQMAVGHADLLSIVRSRGGRTRKKAAPRAIGRDIQMIRDRCGDVDKAAMADLSRPTPMYKYRNPFARMVCSGPGRIIAMIGSNDDCIVTPRPRQNPTESGV